MRFVPIFILITLFCNYSNAYASDFRYYYEYKDSMDKVINKYKRVQAQCNVAYTQECVNLEVHARNILILKISAYQEYANGVVTNFMATFPNADMGEVFETLSKHSGDIANTKYLVTITSPVDLVSREKLVNNVLIENTSTLEVLSGSFHYYKVRKMYDSLKLQHDRLSKELESAKDTGLDTTLAQKHINNAGETLDTADKNIKKASRILRNATGNQLPNDLPSLLKETYIELSKANNSMLQASKILLRFSERSYWRVE